MPQRIGNDDLAQFIDMEGGPEQDALEFHLCCMLDLRDAREELAALDEERPRILRDLARYQEALKIAVEALEAVHASDNGDNVMWWNDPGRELQQVVATALDRIKQYANPSLPKVS